MASTKKHAKPRTGRHATKKDKAHEDRLGTLEGLVGSLRDDLDVVVRTLGDLQDRFESAYAQAIREAQGPSAPASEGPFAPQASVEASNVTGSPMRYLYIYLTPKREEGPHIIVSDAREFGQKKGIAVGMHPHYELPSEDLQVHSSPNAAIVHIGELIGAAT